MRLNCKNSLLSVIFTIISILVVNFKISVLVHYNSFEELISKGFIFSFPKTAVILCLIVLSYQKKSQIQELVLALIFGTLNVVGYYVEALWKPDFSGC